MPDRVTIEKTLNKLIEGTGLFVIDIQVSPSNSIRVLVDNEEGVSLKECMELSRAIESNLDREKEDFQLEVSSPGLSEPLKILPQYLKNMGRDVEIITTGGQKHAGKLLRMGERGPVIEEMVKIKGEKKRPEIRAVENEFDFEQIHSTKVVVKYKQMQK